MDDKKGVKNSEISHIFNTMVYGDDEENVTEAIEWLKTKNNCFFAQVDKPTEAPTGEVYSLKYSYNDDTLCNIYIPETATIENILKKLGEAKTKWIDVAPMKRVESMHQFASAVQKNQNLIIQLEVVARGILNKNTKKSLMLLTDYIQFYSSFASKYDNSSWKPQGLAAGIISDRNCLSALGAILGPALASGYNVVLQTAPQLTVVAALLIDLAIQAGIPEGTIRLIPGHIDPSIFFTASQVGVISIFDDLYKEKYLIGNHFGKKLINFYSSGIPMIVFDNSDLDSACHSILQAAWGYKGLLPWSVRNILIQETVFENFVQKLKLLLSKVSIAHSNKKNIDISYPGPEIMEKVTALTERAKKEGAEIHQPNSKPYPVVLIGGNTFNNNVIKEDIISVPIVTLTAFRTINEAAALANNCRQGLAASVWTESTSLAHEIARKLKVANVWINSHGLFSAEITNSLYKSTGNNHFSGRNGLEEYVQSKILKSEPFAQAPSGEAMEKAISEATKAQANWSKLSRLDRIKFLQTIAQEIAKTSWSLPEKWLNDWITSIHESITLAHEQGLSTIKNFNVLSMREPVGTIAVETLGEIATHNKKLIITALLEGNSVIILNDSKDATALYSFMSSLLHKGVLTVLPSSQNIVKVAALHKQLDAYFGEKVNNAFSSLPLKSSAKFKMAQSDWEEVHRMVTLSKTVWFNVGQSFV